MNWILWGDCVAFFFYFFFFFFHLLSFSHLVRGNVMHVKSLFQIVFIIYYIFFVVAIVVSFISRLSHIKCGMRAVYHMSYFYMIRILCDNTNSFLSGWFFLSCNYQPNERTSIHRARGKKQHTFKCTFYYCQCFDQTFQHLSEFCMKTLLIRMC